MKEDALFHTITSDDWKRELRRCQQERQLKSSQLQQQIKEAMNNVVFEAWVVPTEINTHGKPRKVGGPYPNREEAEEANYFDCLDEPSPDKYEYWRWVVRDSN